MKRSCGCCKRYKDHLGGKINCFLWQMTASNKHSMIMPNRFLNHFGGKISENITLESPNGNLHDVEVTKGMNQTVLRQGWKAFVDANNIEENDSVLFRYIKNSRFEVLILDSYGCEKVVLCDGINDDSCVDERKINYVDISSSTCDDTTQSYWRGGSSSHPRETKKMAAKFCSSGESVQDRFCTVQDSPSENESLEPHDLEPPPAPSPAYVLAHRNYLSDEEKYKVNAFINEVQPKAAVFVAIMKRWNFQYVAISKGYAAEYFPTGCETVTLQTPNKSKKWHPRSDERKNGLFVLRGEWVGFVQDNHVQEGDLCLFIPTKGGRRFTFTVHVLHKSAAANSKAQTCVQIDDSNHGKTTTKKASTDHITEEHTDGEDNSSSESDSDCAREPSYILPMGCCLSQSQNKIVEEKVRAIQSEIPIYVTIMSRSNGHVLEFGARYADAYLPNRKQTAVLHCKGKIWTVNMCISRRQRRILRGGWTQFVRDNRLRAGDICLFELNKNKRKLTMTVYIIFQPAHR